MAAIRYRIEKGFEKFARLIFQNRIKSLLIMLIISTVIISQIPKITVDTSMEGFLHDNDPALLAYYAFRDQFGRDEVIIIAIEAPDVFEQKFLTKLKALHEELEEKVPYIDDINSLINARNTRGEGDELIVEDLLENWPQNSTDMAAIKARALSNPVYKNLMISENGRFTTIIIKTHSLSSIGRETDLMEGFEDESTPSDAITAPAMGKPKYLTDKENSEVVLKVREVMENYKAPDFPFWIAGSPVVTHFLKQAMMKDMRKFVVLAAVTVAIFLFIMFRRVSGVMLPLVVVILSLLCTIGLMAIFNVAIKVPTQILPSFLLAVGVGTSVHVLAIFFQRYNRRGDKEDAIAYALGHSGLAVMMTNVTTACGLLSFSTAELAPIADIGVFAGIGVMLAFINTIVLLPALLAIVPIPFKKPRAGKRQLSVMDRFLTHVGNFSTGHPAAVMVVTGLVVVLSVAAISRIRFSHHPLSWFPKNSAVRTATEKIDHELRGSISLEVVIDTGRVNGLYEPEILKRLEKAATYAEGIEYEGLFVGKAWSLTTVLKEIHQALNENQPQYYRIPQDRKLIAQEFLLFENSGSDDLEDFVDRQFSKARFMIKVPFEDAYKFGNFMETFKLYFDQNFPEATVTLTGMMGLLARTISAAIKSMAKSYVLALLIITILMILLIGRIRIGLLSMIPNLTPILLMLGVIGAFSLSMDLFTMMVASIAIGLAVDDTIHFMHNFRRYYEHSGDPVGAVHETLQTTGRAMLVTTIVLSIGFFLFALATMQNVRNFGMLTGFTIVMALAADFLVAPALMVLVNRKKPIKQKVQS